MTAMGSWGFSCIRSLWRAVDVIHLFQIPSRQKMALRCELPGSLRLPQVPKCPGTEGRSHKVQAARPVCRQARQTIAVHLSWNKFQISSKIYSVYPWCVGSLLSFWPHVVRLCPLSLCSRCWSLLASCCLQIARHVPMSRLLHLLVPVPTMLFLQLCVCFIPHSSPCTNITPSKSFCSNHLF